VWSRENFFKFSNFKWLDQESNVFALFLHSSSNMKFQFASCLYMKIFDRHPSLPMYCWDKQPKKWLTDTEQNTTLTFLFFWVYMQGFVRPKCLQYFISLCLQVQHVKISWTSLLYFWKHNYFLMQSPFLSAVFLLVNKSI
jgi:hypothetical protein